MKFSFYINLKSLIFLITIIQLLHENLVNPMKTQMKFSALDMLEVSNSDKLTEKSSEKTKIKSESKNNSKLKVFEQRFNNFTKDLENVIVNLQFYRKFIEDAISGLHNTPVGSPNEKSLLDVIETNKVNLIKEKNNLKKMIVDFIKFSNEKKTFPNFKETLELNAYTMSTAQLSKLSSMILPKLSDDDYFLDTKDSLVYTYLMNENDTLKRIENIGVNLTLAKKINRTNPSGAESIKKINEILNKNTSLGNKTSSNIKKIIFITEKIKLKNKTIQKNETCNNRTKSDEEKEKSKKKIPQEILECLAEDVAKEKSKQNRESNKTTDSSTSSIPTIQKQISTNKNIVITLAKTESCGSSLSAEGNNLTASLSESFQSKKQTAKNDSTQKLSEKILNILNADIVKTKGVRLEGDCQSSNGTKILKQQPIESLFDLKIDDDENNSNSNSCNKTNFNITIVYVPEKVSLPCNKTVVPPPKPKCANETDPCAGGACAQDVLKKLFLKEMLETKKLKHKLISLYLERKRLKAQKEEKSKLLGGEESMYGKNMPPLFNQSDFEKVKRILIHDTNFIEKRYEEAPIRKLDKSIYSKNKLNFLKPKQHKQIAKEKDNFFTDFQNNFLEKKSNLKNSKQVMNTNPNGIVEAEDINEIHPLNFNEFDFDGKDNFDELDNAASKIPIRFLEKVDFPHYGYLGENVLLE